MPEQDYLTIDRLSTEELTRLFSKIRVLPNDCWEWQGWIHSKTGYGDDWFRGQHEQAHRIFYAAFVEPIPRIPQRGQRRHIPQLDHVMCNTKRCCNPTHTILVMPKLNILRSNGGIGNQCTEDSL